MALMGQALRALHPAEPCGDQIGCWRTADGWRLALADGLGHGREAHHAAVAAMQRLATTAALRLWQASLPTAISSYWIRGAWRWR